MGGEKKWHSGPTELTGDKCYNQRLGTQRPLKKLLSEQLLQLNVTTCELIRNVFHKLNVAPRLLSEE